MANTSSAKKMVRKIAKRTAVNKARHTSMKTAIKKIVTAIEEGSHENAMTAFRAAQPIIAKATQNNIIHKNNASRKISRLNNRIKKLSA